MTKKDDTFTLPSSKSDREKIKKILHEISGQYQMIDDRKSAVKDMVDVLHEEFNIPKKIINKLAKTIHKNDYDDVSHETSLFEIIFEGIVESSNATNTKTDNTEE